MHIIMVGKLLTKSFWLTIPLFNLISLMQQSPTLHKLNNMLFGEECLIFTISRNGSNVLLHC